MDRARRPIVDVNPLRPQFPVIRARVHFRVAIEEADYLVIYGV